MDARKMSAAEFFVGRFADEQTRRGFYFRLTDADLARFPVLTGYYGMRIEGSYGTGAREWNPRETKVEVFYSLFGTKVEFHEAHQLEVRYDV